MPSKMKISKRALIKWLRRLHLRLKGHKGYSLIANNEDDSVSVDDTMLLLGDPYCEYHSADASVSIHCEGLEKRLFRWPNLKDPKISYDEIVIAMHARIMIAFLAANGAFCVPARNFFLRPSKDPFQGERLDSLTALPEEIIERIAMIQPVSTVLKMSQLNKRLRASSIKIMQKIDIESLWVVAHEEERNTVFTVEVQVAGNMEILRSQGQEDVFLCARNAFTTALYILKFFDCSQAVFGVRMNDCTIPPELMHMKFPGVTKFQRVKHVHWSYAAPRQLLRLLSAGAVFF